MLGIVSRKFHRPLLSVAVMSLCATPLLNFRVLPWLLRWGCCCCHVIHRALHLSFFVKCHPMTLTVLA